MGKRAREHRKWVKAELRSLTGLRQYETELGELKVRMTKAEARRRLLFRYSVVYPTDAEMLEMAKDAKYDVIRSMTDAVTLEIDAFVMGEISGRDGSAGIAESAAG